MFSTNTRCELCCFAATCLALMTFLLAIFALDLTIGETTSNASLSLLVAAGVAFLLTIVLTAVAVRMDRKPAGHHRASRARKSSSASGGS